MLQGSETRRFSATLGEQIGSEKIKGLAHELPPAPPPPAAPAIVAAAPTADTSTTLGFDPASVEGVVLPERPVFDKIMALWLLLAFGLGGKSFDDMPFIFWGGEKTGGNVPSNRTEMGWDRRAYYAVDVGENKYQTRGCASSAEVVAEDIGLIKKWDLESLFSATHFWVPEKSAPPRVVLQAKRLARSGLVRIAVKHLERWGLAGLAGDKREGAVEIKAAEVVGRVVSDKRECVALQFVLLASRNNGTGFLKESGRRSVVWLLRELEKSIVADDAIEKVMNAYWTRKGVIHWVLDVIETRFRVEIGQGGQIPSEPELLSGAYEDLFAPGNIGTDWRPFTLATYLRDMIRLGVPAGEVIRRGERLLEDAVGTVEIQLEKAQELLRTATLVQFAEGAGIYIFSEDPRVVDNERVPRALFKNREETSVIVSRRTSGNIAVLTKGDVDLRSAAQELLRREPKLWFYDPKNGCILNDGHSFSRVPATSIPFGEIIVLVEQAMRSSKKAARRDR